MFLQGLGKHQRYARSLLAEAIVALVLLMIAIPRWGIEGAAWVSAALMLLNRGVVTSWLVSKTIRLSCGQYLRSVYGAPLLATLPALALSIWLRSTILPGTKLLQIL